MICINLSEMFGNQYRISYDVAYDPRHIPRAKLDSWMMQIPCQGRGVTIYPHGGDTLAVEVNRRPSVAAKLVALPGVRLYQDGDTEKTFLFDVTLFDQVAAVVGPKRKRILSEKQLEVLSKGRLALEKSRKNELERARTATDDILVAVK